MRISAILIGAAFWIAGLLSLGSIEVTATYVAISAGMVLLRAT